MNTTKKQLMFRLDPEVYAKYRQCLEQRGNSMQQHLEAVVLATIELASTSEVQSTVITEPLEGLLSVFQEQGIVLSPST
jgi:hypothetical protein